MSERYVVAVDECDPQTGPQTFRRYVLALCQASYSNKEGRRWFVDDRDEAFVFTTRAAAEVAAHCFLQFLAATVAHLGRTGKSAIIPLFSAACGRPGLPLP